MEIRALTDAEFAERARAYLRGIEWSGPPGLEAGTCPQCHAEARLHVSQPKQLGHVPGCALAALLYGAVVVVP